MVDGLRVCFLGEWSVVVLVAIGNRVDDWVQHWNIYVWYKVQMDHMVLLLGLTLATGKLRRYEVAGQVVDLLVTGAGNRVFRTVCRVQFGLISWHHLGGFK